MKTLELNPEVKEMVNVIEGNIDSFVTFMLNAFYGNYSKEVINDNINDVAELLVDINRGIKNLESFDALISTSLKRRVSGWYGMIDTLLAQFNND